MPRILLVDDEPLVTGTLQALILGAMPDLEVQSVNSGSEALDLLDRNAYDLVVTDVSMPRISGLELLDHIRKQGSACYVIVLTAYDSFEYAYKASQYEDVRFILKIEPPEVILDAVRSGLESRRVTLRVPPADGKQSVTFGDAFRWLGSIERRNLPALMDALRNGIRREGYPGARQKCAVLLQMQLQEVFGENCLEGLKIDGCTAETILLYRSYPTAEDWLIQVRSLLESLFFGGAAQASETDETLDRINRYIQEHFSEPISLARIAEHFNYNSSYLSRFYKQNMREGINEHITRVRIEAACRLLRDGELRVGVIAEQCGFQTAKYFITAFRRVKGMTPKSWRDSL